MPVIQVALPLRFSLFLSPFLYLSYVSSSVCLSVEGLVVGWLYRLSRSSRAKTVAGNNKFLQMAS